MELSAMESVWHPIPQPGGGGRLGPADTGRQYPGIHRVTAEGLRVLLTGLGEFVLVAQLLGDDTRVQVERQPLLLEQPIEVFLAHLYRTERLVPLLAALPRA